MHRDNVIEKLVSKYREVLEEKDDEDLLGSTAREQARERAAESLVEIALTTWKTQNLWERA